MRQKAGEIQAYRGYEKETESGARNTHREKEKEISLEEGQEILEDRDIWTNEITLRGVIHESRRRERRNEDGVFILHRLATLYSFGLALSVVLLLFSVVLILIPPATHCGEKTELENQHTHITTVAYNPRAR